MTNSVDAIPSLVEEFKHSSASLHRMLLKLIAEAIILQTKADDVRLRRYADWIAESRARQN